MDIMILSGKLILPCLAGSSLASLALLPEFLELLHQLLGDTIILKPGELFIGIKRLHKDAVFRVKDRHHAKEDLKCYLTDAFIGRMHGEIVLNVDIAVTVNIELHITDFAVQNVAGFHDTGALFFGRFSYQAEDPYCHIVVVITADELHNNFGAAVDRKTGTDHFVPPHVLDIKTDAALFKGLRDQVGCLEFIFAHFRISFRVLFCGSVSVYGGKLENLHVSFHIFLHFRESRTVAAGLSSNKKRGPQIIDLRS